MPRRAPVVMSIAAGAGGGGAAAVAAFAAVVAVAAGACGKGGTPSSGAAGSAAAAAGAGSATAGSGSDSAGAPAGSGSGSASALPPHRRYATLVEALRATIPADTRVVGFGELHARVDRAQVRSALAAFTEALPSFGAQVSDLVVETWIVDPKCGKQAVTATKKIEAEVKRPEATKSEITLLADAARAAKIQPHAMTLTCKDYAKLAPEEGPADPVAMLGLVTRELVRVTTSAVRYRDKQPEHRPWIVVYGGALHNDRFPAAGVAEWSYADSVDLVSDGRYVEIDLIVPEFAEPDKSSQAQPWFPLVAAADQVLVFARGERSFVMILPRTPRTPP